MHNLPRIKKLLFAVPAVLVILDLIYLASGTYGKTDDYVIFGLFRTNNSSVIDSFKYISAQEWNAGRWIDNLFLSIMFQDGTSISTLTLLRLITVAILICGFVIYIKKLGVLESSLITRLIIAAPILLVPGIHTFISLSVSNPYILAMVLGLIVSSQLVKEDAWTPRKVIYFMVALSFICAIYQASIFMALLFPALNIVKSHFSKASSQRLWSSFLLTCVVLFINWLAIKNIIDSSRSNIDLDLLAKIDVFVNVVIDQAVLPWLKLGHVSYDIKHSITLLVVVLNILMTLSRVRSNADINDRKNILQYLAIVFCATGGLPFTMPWFFVINENALDFRRYTFATIIFASLFLYNIINISKLKSNRDLRKMTKTLLLILITITFIFVAHYDFQTRQILVREWSLFSCASLKVELPEVTRIDSASIREILQGDRPVSEDFATASISLPNPPTFMLWISQKQARPKLSYLPWNLNFIGPDSELKETPEGARWRNAFIECYTEKR